MALHMHKLGIVVTIAALLAISFCKITMRWCILCMVLYSLVSSSSALIYEAQALPDTTNHDFTTLDFHKYDTFRDKNSGFGLQFRTPQGYFCGMIPQSSHNLVLTCQGNNLLGAKIPMNYIAANWGNLPYAPYSFTYKHLVDASNLGQKTVFDTSRSHWITSNYTPADFPLVPAWSKLQYPYSAVAGINPTCQFTDTSTTCTLLGHWHYLIGFQITPTECSTFLQTMPNLQPYRIPGPVPQPTINWCPVKPLKI